MDVPDSRPTRDPFSDRSRNPAGEASPWIREVEQSRRRGSILYDLSRTDPTGWTSRADAEMRALGFLVRKDASVYQPDPAGLSSARAFLAERFGGSARDWILTASTSEAYSILFQLLADPGDHAAICRPSYPLLDDLARHGGIGLREIPLRRFQGDWRLDLGWTERVLRNPSTRFLALIQPGNPTGWWLDEKERRVVLRTCACEGKAIVCDEVFRDDLHRPGFASLAGEDSCLCFVLGGLSKSLGLPHLKLGWIRVSGPDPLVREALERLERLNDGLLSASTPVQAALPDLFSMREELRGPIDRRIRENLSFLEEFPFSSKLDLVPSNGGWVRILDLGDRDEIEFSQTLIHQGVLVQPGFLFDLKGNHIVLSLLSVPEEFMMGLRIINSI